MRCEGDFNDGRSAARQRVGVHLAAGELTLLDAAGATRERWRLADVELAEEVFAGQPVRLRRAGSDEQLTLRDPAVIPWLRRLAPHLRGQLPRGRGHPRLLLVGVALAALLLGAIALALRSPPLLARLVPESWELALGQRLVQAQPEAWCRGEAGMAVLDALGQRLVRGAGLTYPLTIQVGAAPVVNAVTLPGGQIIVFRGLLDLVEQPDELAAVLAHETSHVAYRHPLEGLIREVGSSLVLRALLGATGGGGTSAQLGKNLVLLSHTREAEFAADRRGMAILRAAGIRPAGMIRFLERIRQRQGDIPAAMSYLSTHPINAERIAALRGLEQDGAPAMSAAQWASVKAICR